eukprot:scaffold538_cov412-Prasinococcus_capsulatus_cf.AAC.1
MTRSCCARPGAGAPAPDPPLPPRLTPRAAARASGRAQARSRLPHPAPLPLRRGWRPSPLGGCRSSCPRTPLREQRACAGRSAGGRAQNIGGADAAGANERRGRGPRISGWHRICPPVPPRPAALLPGRAVGICAAGLRCLDKAVSEIKIRVDRSRAFKARESRLDRPEGQHGPSCAHLHGIHDSVQLYTCIDALHYVSTAVLQHRCSGRTTVMLPSCVWPR